MGYSLNFLFFKMRITKKIEVRIGSNFLHSIRTSICIRDVLQIGSDFGVIFEKTIGSALAFWLI